MYGLDTRQLLEHLKHDLILTPVQFNQVSKVLWIIRIDVDNPFVAYVDPNVFLETLSL
jgi:hypothetical protein